LCWACCWRIIGLAVVMFEALVVETRGWRADRQMGLEAAGFIIGGQRCLFGILLGGLPKLGVPAMGLIAAISC
jgi:hypothetical protein